MAQTVGEFVLRRLLEWGVRRIYGYPGDGINGIMGGFHKVKEMQFIQVRHEEMAAFMACAHAKFTGRGGRLPGDLGTRRHSPPERPLRRARWITSRWSPSSASRRARHWAANTSKRSTCISLFKDVAHEYVHMAIDARAGAPARSIARCGSRMAERTVTCIIVPNDVQEMDAVSPNRRVSTAPCIRASVSRRRAILPHEEDLRRAAEVLNAGKRVAMLVGQGALGAPDEVQQAADLLGAGVAKALLGKAVLPDELPFVTGSIGLLGTKPSWDLMSECDTLFMIGSSFPYSEFLPEEGQARGVQIDIDRAAAQPALPDGGQPGRRRRRDAAGAHPAAAAQSRPVAGASRSRRAWPTGGRCWRRGP